MKNNQDLHMELFDKIDKQFAEHLSVKGNERIIFSGRFGQGKTTFLIEFFKDDNQEELFNKKNKYNVIHLYPVNYSIASNEDIFKYIKHDIILELLNSNSNIQDDIISYLSTLPAYLKKNAHKILAAFVGMIPCVGKDIVESFERFNKLKVEYLKYHNKQEKRYNEYAVLGEFIESLRSAEGSIYEDNIVSKLIEDILSKKDKNKENVLIIDDLDRIDPEHIFRLLNVFSAHFDRRHQGNKFGFDKIIIVCDIDNIRGIFKAKYGTSTDFNGYIDKFYSHRIFDFNNRVNINSLARHLFYKAGWSTKESDISVKQSLLSDRNKIESNVSFLYEMLFILSQNGELQLRSILKLEKYNIHYVSNLKINGIYFSLYEEPILMFIRMLIQLKGDPASLIDSLKRCDRVVTSGNFREYITELIRIFLSIHTNDHAEKDHEYDLDGMKLVFSKRKDGYSLSNVPQGSFELTQAHLLYVLQDVVKLFNIATTI